MRVAVAGASGYAGGEVVRLLLSHPEFEIGTLTASRSVGSTLRDHHPHLFPLAERVLADTAPESFEGHDAVVLALPHGASAPLAAQLPADLVVIDCGADFRLTDQQAWAQYYDTPYAGAWSYGLPELPTADGGRLRAELIGQRRIAVPGCYPTGVSLALAPGLAAGLLEPSDIVVVAASGTSGAGKTLRSHLLASTVIGSMSPYGVGGSHRHVPEIEQNLARAAGRTATVSFTPVLAPMPRGIIATCTARLSSGVSSCELRSVWQDSYQNEPFIRLLPEGIWPSTGSVLGSNIVAMQLAYDDHAERVVVVAVEDNLTKGTAGAVVQCLNLAFGLPETTGLSTTGVAP
ncbi:N-acetyl-gamma-glutamyl-phosphate reductase [Austwickia chelonae]|uniref:N-acetyl-gamma-glutamyl-phosphate reductase n=1 Tax=Austwickia chelonae NBRC 105200 TaxID=1184607 RepID=K6UKJ5_9MICO|nr:N-acetyl-gamma-glutamyl-phosphate reductase [Austwickia chelonae]GAB76446.1 N-acetyl-gamma-glutamyl-phosphate reductase [Austwickia chelonae NBRC 105200]SEW24818.1 N-acetyl-gamma-glutamyl-phosphate reductase [Austwickia chelonae]